MEGTASAWRGRSIEENLAAWREMQTGSEEGLRHCLRLKMDPTAPNKALRDPAAYRCNLTPHHRTGTRFKARPLLFHAFTPDPSLPCQVPHRAALPSLRAASKRLCLDLAGACSCLATPFTSAPYMPAVAKSHMRTCRCSRSCDSHCPHRAAERWRLLRDQPGSA